MILLFKCLFAVEQHMIIGRCIYIHADKRIIHSVVDRLDRQSAQRPLKPIATVIMQERGK